MVDDNSVKLHSKQFKEFHVLFVWGNWTGKLDVTRRAGVMFVLAANVIVSLSALRHPSEKDKCAIAKCRTKVTYHGLAYVSKG